MFKKYVEIENSYRQKYINDFFERHPEAINTTYIIQEKIDGCNISFIFSWNEELDDYELQVAKRSGVIKENEKFYDIQTTLNREDIKLFISEIKRRLKTDVVTKNAKNITLYGEYYGPGIQKRIDYGDKKSFIFFDMALDGKYVDINTFEYIIFPLKNLGFEHLFSKILFYGAFEECLNYNTSFNSKIGPDPDSKELHNECEGVVIKQFMYPTFEPFYDQYGHQDIFYIKIKNEKFNEKMKVKHKKRPEKMSEDFYETQTLFESYLTENRLLGIFSKEGMIQSQKEIGKYIKLMTEDAKKDFMKDHGDLMSNDKLTEKEKKKIFSSSGKIVSKLIMENYL